MSEHEDRSIERAVLERGLLTEDQIADARNIQKAFGGAWSLKDVLIARKLVTREQFAELEDQAAAGSGEAASDPATGSDTLNLEADAGEPDPAQAPLGSQGLGDDYLGDETEAISREEAFAAASSIAEPEPPPPPPTLEPERPDQEVTLDLPPTEEPEPAFATGEETISDVPEPAEPASEAAPPRDEDGTFAGDPAPYTGVTDAGGSDALAAALAGGQADDEATLIAGGNPGPEPEPAPSGAPDDAEATLVSGDYGNPGAMPGPGGSETLADVDAGLDEDATLGADDQGTLDDAATLITGQDTVGVDEGETLMTGGDLGAPGSLAGLEDEGETLLTSDSGPQPAPTLDDAETLVTGMADDAETMLSDSTSGASEADLDDAATMVTESRMTKEDEVLEDSVFGEICIELGWATSEQIDKAWEMVEERRALGKPHRLGAILVDDGVLEEGQVAQILQQQRGRVLVCESCGGRTSAGETQPGTLAACSKCASELTVPSAAPEVSHVEVREYLEYKSRGPVSVSSADESTPGGEGMQLIGSTIGGCKITKKLGEGGMGAVYKGVHEALRRESAIKILPSTYANNPTLVARFFREARAAGKIRHPNIVEVFNVGQDAGLHFIEMEFVRGGSLKDMMEEADGPMELDDALRVIKETCVGLHAAHEGDVIHRDIKPDNIMITTEGSIKIADFGLARSVEGESMDLTKTGQIMGTPTYISPEQADAQKTDRRTDIYSLGATFYHMVTGEKPFTGESPMVILLKHINEEPVPPTQHNADLPPSVAMIIDKMMAKRLDQRYGSLEEVIKDIDAYQNGATISYKIKKKKKFPVKRVVAAALVVFVATIAGVVYMFSTPEFKARKELSRAQGLFEEGDLAGAREALSASIGIYDLGEAPLELRKLIDNEENFAAAMASADQRIRSRQWIQAKSDLDVATNLKPEDEAARDLLRQANFEVAFAEAEELAKNRQWAEAKTKYNRALDLAVGDEEKARVNSARDKATALALDAQFEKHIKDAEVALGQAQYTQAKSLVTEAAKLKKNDPRIEDLTKRINEGIATEAAEQEFRQNLAKGDEAYGNRQYAEAISFYDFCDKILKDTPALAKIISKEIDKLEKQKLAAQFGRRMKDGQAAADRGKHWDALDLYKQAVDFGTEPEQSNAKRAIYKLAMEVGVPAWEDREDKTTAKRAVEFALYARPDDADALALQQQLAFVDKTPEGMIYIPGGAFTAGSDDPNEARTNSKHDVVLKPFYIDQNEVTNREFFGFVKAGGYEKEEYWDAEGWAMIDKLVVNDGSARGPKSWATTDNYGGQLYDDYPVVGVNWYEARAYARWKGKRLPTDDEWEFAAAYDKATGATRPYPWGPSWDVSKGNFRSVTAPVPISVFKTDVSPWGCYNMGGNAMEWCASPDPSNPEVEIQSTRGGSFQSGDNPAQARVPNLRRSRPTGRITAAGFRCALDAQ